MRPLALRSSFSARRFLVQSRFEQSGKTSRLTARREPSRERAKAPTSTGSLVTATGSPPSGASFHTCDEPERVERNQRDFRSADQRGPVSEASWVVRRRRFLPSTPTSQRSLRRRLASRSTALTVKATQRPSGETRGSLKRSKATRSRTLKGWVVAAVAVATRPGAPQRSAA